MPPVTVAVTGTIRVANDQSAGEVAVTRGGAIPIVKETGADVLVLPAASRAMLVSLCTPLASAETSMTAE